MATTYDLFGYVDPVRRSSGAAGWPTRTRLSPDRRHRHGTYETHQLAQWWAINAKGVWVGGDEGPRNVFVPLRGVDYWQIVERQV